MSSLGLYANGKKLSFHIELGWYTGEEFSVVKVELLTIWGNRDGVTIIGIKTAYLQFSIGFTWEGK